MVDQPTMPKGGPGAWATKPSDAQGAPQTVTEILLEKQRRLAQEEALRGYSVPGADGLTKDEAKARVENAERSVAEALEKIERIEAEKKAIDEMDVDVSVKKEEPVRWVSALIVLLAVVLNVSNAQGWTTFTAVEQTTILGAAAVLGNEVARMHVTAPSKQ